MYQTKWPKMAIFLLQNMRNLHKSVLSQPRICRPLPLEMERFSGEMWNVLNRMKNEIFFFSFFIFRVIVKIHRKLGWWRHKNDHNSKNKNRKNLKYGFSFNSADSGSLILILLQIEAVSKLVYLHWIKLKSYKS